MEDSTSLVAICSEMPESASCPFRVSGTSTYWLADPIRIRQDSKTPLQQPSLSPQAASAHHERTRLSFAGQQFDRTKQTGTGCTGGKQQ